MKDIFNSCKKEVVLIPEFYIKGKEKGLTEKEIDEYINKLKEDGIVYEQMRNVLVFF